jgi:TPR repeat protein
MPEVYYKLGYCYEQTDDYQAAVRNYKKAADNGNADAQYRLGLCTEQGKGITINKSQAIEWYRKAANQGHVEAEQELNRLIKEQHIANWKKTGLEKFNTRSYEQALQLYKQAADAGDIESLYWIGNCYY